MPKRTNEFQRLVKQIYEQAAGTDCTVEESALIREGSDGSEREVDVLLTQVICGTPLHIAIECRNWRTKNDVTWIDGLIGKYRSLKINKVIAVSASGFTAPAMSKAEANGILALTLREALDTDWDDAFTKLGLLQIEQSFHFVSARVETEPPLNAALTESAPLYLQDGTLFSTIRELCEVIVARNKTQIAKDAGKKLADGQRTVADLANTVAEIELSHTIDMPLFLDHDGSRYRLNCVTLRLISKFEPTAVPVEHKALGDLRISTSEMVDSETRTVYEVTAIQQRARPGQAKVRVSPKNKDAKLSILEKNS